MTKLAGILLISAVMFLVLKRDRPEFALISELAVSVAVFLMISDKFGAAATLIEGSFSAGGLPSGLPVLLLKTAGIALTAQLASDICSDAGEGAAASQAELAGKVLMLSAAVPFLEEIIKLVEKLVDNI